jgi:hypothetical protein
VDYFLVTQQRTWLDALTACPAVNPEWTLATITDDREWQVLVNAMQREWTRPGAPAVGFYNGAWVGLSSPDPVPATVASTGPWTTASNWQWTNNASRKGSTITPYIETKWGAAGTGYQGSAQPDNSGGRQHCVLIAAGTSTLPITDSTAFLDDQNCGFPVPPLRLDSQTLPTLLNHPPALTDPALELPWQEDPIVNTNMFFCEDVRPPARSQLCVDYTPACLGMRQPV